MKNNLIKKTVFEAKFYSVYEETSRADKDHCRMILKIGDERLHLSLSVDITEFFLVCASAHGESRDKIEELQKKVDKLIVEKDGANTNK